MTPEFQPFPKIGRWANNKIAITEKIDGTNGSIAFRVEAPSDDPTVLASWHWPEVNKLGFTWFDPMGPGFPDSHLVVMRAGSRNRWLTRSTDNYGFAAWVQANAAELLRLGQGQHFGEWWGSGIQRGYGLAPGDKRFSLFNVGRWVETPTGVVDKLVHPAGVDKPRIAAPGLGVVPTLYYGGLRDASGACMIEQAMKRLQFAGSQAAPGFKNPEGVMIYFEALKTYSKAPFDPNPKGQG